jgi:aspartyl-tRNA(Asn)/glutamyl-tRNA(Gln) amidotransferase subunit B
VKQAIANNTKAVSDYKAGKQQALAFITGQVMKATRGRADPSLTREVIIQELGGK